MQKKKTSYLRSTADYEIGKMEQTARKRRERLLAMKNDANKTEKVIMKKPQVKFRIINLRMTLSKKIKWKELKFLISVNIFRLVKYLFINKIFKN